MAGALTPPAAGQWGEAAGSPGWRSGGFAPPGQVALAAPPPPPPVPRPIAPQLPPPALLSPVRLGPPPPTLWQRAWPIRAAAATRPALYATFATAVIAAVAVPPDRPGVGWSIAGLGLLVPLALLLATRPAAPYGPAAREPRRPDARREAAAGAPVAGGSEGAAGVGTARPPEPAVDASSPGAVVGASVAARAGGTATVRPGEHREAERRPGARVEAVLWCVAALALLSVGLFRAAGWLFVLSALSAFGCVALAVGRHRRVPAVLAAPFTLLAAAFRGLPWAAAGVIQPRTSAAVTDRSAPTRATTPQAAATRAAPQTSAAQTAVTQAAAQTAAAQGAAQTAVTQAAAQVAAAQGAAQAVAAQGVAQTAATQAAAQTAAIQGVPQAAATQGTAAQGWAPAGAVRAGNNGLRLLVSIGIGVVLVVVFGALFAGADPGFAKVVDAVVPSVDAGTVVRWALVGVLAAGLALGGAFLVANPSTIGDRPADPRPVRRIEWLVPVGALLALFVVFVAVQVTVLFGDREYVMKTVGLTFAQYARKGFWQLLAITFLTLCVMAFTVRKAPAADRGLLRLVLGVLALCSLVVVGSALWRMNVYEEAYGFTRLRVFVSAVELWLGALFVLVLLAGLTRSAPWLGRAGVALWVVVLLGLAVLNPDRLIAARNVERADRGNADIWYLSTLSADAAPELDRLPAGQRECALSEISGDLADDPDEWRGWNLSRAHARHIVPKPIRPGDYPCYRRY